MTTCLFPALKILSEKVSALKEKNLLPLEKILSFRIGPFFRRETYDRVAAPETVFIPLE